MFKDQLQFDLLCSVETVECSDRPTPRLSARVATADGDAPHPVSTLYGMNCVCTNKRANEDRNKEAHCTQATFNIKYDSLTTEIWGPGAVRIVPPGAGHGGQRVGP